MNVIDPRTAIVLISAMSALMALVLWALKRSYPPSIQGLGQWAQALLIIVVGGILAASRGQLPEILTTAVPNFLLCWGVYGLYAGTQRFYGVRPATWRWLAVTVAVTLGTLWFALGDPSYTARLRLVTALLAVMFAVHAWFIVRQGMGSFSRWLTVGVIVYIAVIQLVRLATTFFLPMGDTILSGTPQHVLFIASFSVSVLLFSVGAVLMAGDRLRAELELLATRDSLTNTLTRRYMDEACAIELERSHRTGQPLAMLMLDLDHFKTINDTHGHQAGDDALAELGRIIRSRQGKDYIAARLGGEEFVVLARTASLQEAWRFAERVRADFALAQEALGCTLSGGLAERQQGEELSSMLRRADEALYRAKSTGRDRLLVAARSDGVPHDGSA